MASDTGRHILAWYEKHPRSRIPSSGPPVCTRGQILVLGSPESGALFQGLTDKIRVIGSQLIMEFISEGRVDIVPEGPPSRHNRLHIVGSYGPGQAKIQSPCQNIRRFQYMNVREMAGAVGRNRPTFESEYAVQP